MGASLHGRRIPVPYENAPPSPGSSYHPLILCFSRKLLGEGVNVAGAWENCFMFLPVASDLAVRHHLSLTPSEPFISAIRDDPCRDGGRRLPSGNPCNSRE